MKKLLLIPVLSAALVGCGDPIDNAYEVAQDYCEAIKDTNFDDARSLSTGYVVDANERWFDKDNRKYYKVFKDQRCSIKNVEASEDNTKFTVYYSGTPEAKGSYVEIEYSEDKGEYLVTGDMFAVYQYFY